MGDDARITIYFHCAKGVTGNFKSHHIRRCPIFVPKQSEQQKKVITFADVQFSSQNKDILEVSENQFS